MLNPNTVSRPSKQALWLSLAFARNNLNTVFASPGWKSFLPFPGVLWAQHNALSIVIEFANNPLDALVNYHEILFFPSRKVITHKASWENLRQLGKLPVASFSGMLNVQSRLMFLNCGERCGYFTTDFAKRRPRGRTNESRTAS
jgi:hypothetical protein